VKKACLLSLTATLMAVSAFDGNMARAQPSTDTQAPVHRSQPNYPPGYHSAAPMMETEPLATGSIVTTPRQMNPLPGETRSGYCSRKYPAYDSISNTYRGSDGLQYPCE
jgi:hypothetical protein